MPTLIFILCNLFKVLAAHPLATYLHIGCDEVYELGKGKSVDIMAREKIKMEHIFLRHVKRVAQIVKDESKGKVRPIIWDDELRNIEESVIVVRLSNFVFCTFCP